MDAIDALIALTTGKSMAHARGGNPKYVVDRAPQVGVPIEVFEYYPTDRDIADGEYRSGGEVTPAEIVEGAGDDVGWFAMVTEGRENLVVYHSKRN